MVSGQILCPFRYRDQISAGPTTLRQVALAHERTYSQPVREGKAGRRRARACQHQPDVAPPVMVDVAAAPAEGAVAEGAGAAVAGEEAVVGDAAGREEDEGGEQEHGTAVFFPESRSRPRVPTSQVPGLADALHRWIALEWDQPGCPAVVPPTVQLMNYLELQDTRTREVTTVHASPDFYAHAWHDSVASIDCTWMNLCHCAFLFFMPQEYPEDGKLYSCSVALGSSRKGRRLRRVIPMLLCTPMVPFWPFDAPQPRADPDRPAPSPPDQIPPALQGTTLADYATPAMQKCGRLLQHHSHVRAWIAPQVQGCEWFRGQASQGTLCSLDADWPWHGAVAAEPVEVAVAI